MAFTTWTALRTAIKDAIANHVAGSPCTGEYAIGDRRLKYRSFEELVGLYQKTYVMESLEARESNGPIRNFVRFGDEA
jgi:hypothetical protein